MSLFAKIYGVVLLLFIVAVGFTTFQVTTQHIGESEKLKLDKQRITGSLVTSEIQRWHAEGKWPFSALHDLTRQDDFMFWWIVAEDNTIYLADQAEYAGTDASSYFPEMNGRLLAPEEDGSIVVNGEKGFGIFSRAFSVGAEQWSFWLGFSTTAIGRAKQRIILSALSAAGIGLFLLGIILFVIVHRFLRPLQDLSRGAQKIGEGELAHRLTIHGRDELAIVSESFNQMAEKLQVDIARREQTEKALQNSEELYRSLVENINLGITLIDQEHTIVMANAFQGRMLGKSPREFSGRKCFKEFEQRDDVCPYCPGVQAMQNGVPNEVVTRGKRKDGSPMTVRTRAFPLTAENGGKGGFIEVTEDITEQVRMQEDLAAEKERLAVTLRSIGDGVITTDTEGRIMLLNRMAEKLTAWDRMDAVGRPLSEVFHIIDEQTRVACENPVEIIMGAGQIIALPNRTTLVAKDGTERRIADSGAPILDAKSNIVGVVLVFRDVTEQIRTERELLKVQKLESIGVLAGGIAHDFNNILTAILGNINLALFDNDLRSKTRKLLTDAEKASLRARDLTQQLLTFAKGGEPVKELSSLETVIKDSANFVMHGDKVACRYHIPEDLWLVNIDRGQISQVIQNIVLNARQAMPEGGAIRVSCQNLAAVEHKLLPYLDEDRYVRITIQDNGIGMPANVLEKIFDPYFTTKREGSGLGLAITQSIIKKHKGHITVESSPGNGSTFTILLPASEKTEVPEQSLAASRQAVDRAKTLLMDDDETVREVGMEMLSRLGHEVACAADGEEAVRLYQEAMHAGRRFDLVIMDLTIAGGMGGQEAVQEVKKIDPAALVIVSSGYFNDPVMANFSGYGFSAAIVKPYQLQELAKVITRILPPR